MQSPAVTYNARIGTWILLEPFYMNKSGVIISIPSGYETDLASIPRMFWRVIAPFELSIAAPLVHDYLYGNGGVAQNQVLTREETDKLFLDIMEAEGVSWWRRKIAYRAVRMFAGFAWRERE